MTEPTERVAAELMLSFAERTGLRGDAAPRRYLWTDAFAVCNFLGLAQTCAEPVYRSMATELIAQVHRVLGHHRADDRRRGWLSGLGEEPGAAHPTRGGLRIGKPLPERSADEPANERKEWDRDGQYFHYLTKWMHALDQAARATADVRCSLWARELSQAAFTRFVYLTADGAEPRMHWKMSIDLRRPLVQSMGQHDPIDGYVTCLQLRATARALPGAASQPDLADQPGVWQAMLRRGRWETADPLGLGGLLMDAYRLAQLKARGADATGTLIEQLLAAAAPGLQQYARGGEWQAPAQHRLGFRELGLAIGLQALQRMPSAPPGSARGRLLRTLRRHAALGGEIERFWREPAQWRTPGWLAHQDINEVMLATCLAADGFLELEPAHPVV